MEEFYVWHTLSSGTYYPTDLLFYKNFEGLTGFSSLYGVTLESSEALRREGTIAGFTGAVWSERLWLDIDGYDKAEKVELKLKEMKLDYIAYDSGGKGAHFGILRNHAPSHLLPKKDRAWAISNFPEADHSIYTPLHLFRLPGTRHQETGRVKEEVSRNKTGSPLILPNLDIKRTRNNGTRATTKESIFKDGRLLFNIKTAKVGERHARLVKVAYALKENQVDPSYAAWFLGEVNKLFTEAKNPEQVNKIVESIFSKP